MKHFNYLLKQRLTVLVDANNTHYFVTILVFHTLQQGTYYTSSKRSTRCSLKVGDDRYWIVPLSQEQYKNLFFKLLFSTIHRLSGSLVH